MVQGMLFPAAEVVTDVSVDRKAWPKHPVIYGGAHVNHLTRALALPVTIDRDKIVVGDLTFEGKGMRFLGVIPANSQAHHPDIMLYAGTGDMGVAEINSVQHGNRPWLVADAFGTYVTGRFEHGKPVADGGRGHRVKWRTRESKNVFEGPEDSVLFHFVDKLDASPDEDELVAAGVRGIARAKVALEIDKTPQVSVYVYPDARSKKSITGDIGAGHAVPAAGVLHVVQMPKDRHDDFENLVAHEMTHVLAAQDWGQVGTPLMGEGLAVWASGYYGGDSLTKWSRRAHSGLDVATLLTSFRKLPEKQTYPFAGLLVGAMVDTVGLEAMRDHLYSATAATWAAAEKKAGVSSAALETKAREPQPDLPGF